jgi:TRAP-type C4-dicarboxylate transport system permease small subunit
MSHLFRRAMDALYWGCWIIAGVSLVLISVVIPWGVFTRYVLNSASSWPEPMAILLTVVMTFFGSAACYRARLQMRLSVVTNRMPKRGAAVADYASELLVALTGLFMALWGYDLVVATWHQVIPEFPFLSVGLTYAPIPIGGFLLLLFVVERLLLGIPPGIEPTKPGAH